MNTLKQWLFTDWHIMRLVRLGIALVLGFQAWQVHDGWLALLSGLFLLQAATNQGCCGTGGCAVNPRQSTSTRHVPNSEVVTNDKNKILRP